MRIRVEDSIRRKLHGNTVFGVMPSGCGTTLAMRYRVRWRLCELLRHLGRSHRRSSRTWRAACCVARIGIRFPRARRCRAPHHRERGLNAAFRLVDEQANNRRVGQFGVGDRNRGARAAHHLLDSLSAVERADQQGERLVRREAPVAPVGRKTRSGRMSPPPSKTCALSA